MATHACLSGESQDNPPIFIWFYCYRDTNCLAWHPKRDRTAETCHWIQRHGLTEAVNGLRWLSIERVVGYDLGVIYRWTGG